MVYRISADSKLNDFRSIIFLVLYRIPLAHCITSVTVNIVICETDVSSYSITYSLLIILNCFHFDYNRLYYLILYRIISLYSSSIAAFFFHLGSCLVSACLCLTIKENFCDKCLMSYATWPKRRNRMQAGNWVLREEWEGGARGRGESGRTLRAMRLSAIKQTRTHCAFINVITCVLALPLCRSSSLPLSPRYDQ